MNLLYGEITELKSEDGAPMARVRVGGALQRVAIGLLPEARCGDTVLICDGVAIGKVHAGLENDDYVPGNTRKTD